MRLHWNPRASEVRPKGRERRRSAGWKRRIGMVAVLGLVLVAALEITLRLGYRQQLMIRRNPQIYAMDPHLGYRYIPGSDTEIHVPSIHKKVRINQNGYYGPSFHRKKPDGVYRIAIVGSSQSTGIWLQGDRPYPQGLQARFDEIGTPVEVLNFSIDGRHRQVAILRQIEAEVLQYTPDLVLVRLSVPFPEIVVFRTMYRGYVIHPGYSPMQRAQIQNGIRQARRYIDWLEDGMLRVPYDLSYIVRGVCRWWSRYSGGQFRQMVSVYQQQRFRSQIQVPKSAYEGSLELVRQTIRASSERGTEVILLSFERREQWAEFPTIYLDVPNSEALRHEHDHHFNQQGHDLIADRLFDALNRRWRVRPDRSPSFVPPHRDHSALGDR